MTKKNVLELDNFLSFLRSADRFIENVLETFLKVKIFDFDIVRGWRERETAEGSLHLVKRVQSPVYKFIILGHKNKFAIYPNITDIPISQYCLLQSFQQFYMIKNENGHIIAIKFLSKSDCDRICQKVARIMKEGVKYSYTKSNSGILMDRKILATPIKVAMNNNDDDDKIINLLESAKQRFHNVNGKREQVSLNSRQIDINELFTIKDNNAIKDNKISLMNPSQRASTIYKSYSYHDNKDSVDMIDENATIALTVTELENYLVKGASLGEGVKNYIIDSDDDDIQLLDPQKLIKCNIYEEKEALVPVLSREQFKETLLSILQNDDEDGGLFLCRLHSAYVDLCHRK